MLHSLVGRADLLEALGAILDAGRDRTVVACLRGEAGIGKTSVLEAVRNTAAASGHLVLACAPNSAEVHLSYAALSDLLAPLAPRLDQLPAPQRRALEVALLRRDPDGAAPDVRTLGAATLSLLTLACRESPVLVCVDDAPWLDEASLRAVGFAVRRAPGPCVLLTTARDGHDNTLESLAPARGPEPTTMRLGPLTTSDLRELLLTRLGTPPDRSTLARIDTFAGGNPLLALELARGSDTPDSQSALALTSAMRRRFRALPPSAREVLLLMSAAAAPTAPILRRAGVADVSVELAPAEQAGIVRWAGNRPEVTHPVWREIVYRDADDRARRNAHLRLARAVTDAEERARHLALGTVEIEPATLEAIRAGAKTARMRGAPSAAAGLLRLALDRGATAPELRLEAATDHFAAGEPDSTRELATALVDDGTTGSVRAGALCLLGETSLHEEDFPRAVELLEQAHAEEGISLAAKTGIAIDLAFASSNLGDQHGALEWALRAEEYAGSVGDEALTAEASAYVAVLRFLCGQGVDLERIEDALDHEDPERESPVHRWPSFSAAVLFLGCQDLDRARATLTSVRARCLERGWESGLWLVLIRQLELAFWSGDLRGARSAVSQLVEWTAIARDDSLSAAAGAGQVLVAAWTGELDEAREAYQRLLALDEWAHPVHNFAAMAGLGMAEHAAGNIGPASELLATVADISLALGIGEPMASPFFAEAIEVLVAHGEPERVIPLVEFLERWAEGSGTRWPRGAGHRGRAVLALHAGDLEAATHHLGLALECFDTPGLRYDRARTQLLVADVYRRRRKRAMSRVALVQAGEVFDAMGLAGWAAHTQRDLARLGLQRVDDLTLTHAERRIAELAASGLTNVRVASQLAVSPKTVEAHLARVYRKLGIRSRAELGQWLAHLNQS